MTNNCDFYVHLLIFQNMKFVARYGLKQILGGPIEICKQ